MKSRPTLITLAMYGAAAVALGLLLELLAAVFGLQSLRYTIAGQTVAPHEFLVRAGVAHLVQVVLLALIVFSVATDKVWSRDLVIITCGVVGALDLSQAMFSDTTITLDFSWLVTLIIAWFYLYRSFEGQSYYASLQVAGRTHSRDSMHSDEAPSGGGQSIS